MSSPAAETKVPSKPLTRPEGDNPNPVQGEEVVTEGTAGPGQNDTHATISWGSLTMKERPYKLDEPDPITAKHSCPPWCYEASEYALQHPDGPPFRHEAQIKNSHRVCNSASATVPLWRYEARRLDDQQIAPASLEVELEEWHAGGEPFVKIRQVFHGPQSTVRTVALRIEEATHLAMVLAAAVDLAAVKHEDIS